MKVFISYSSDDLALAGRVFGEIVRGGATPFQYGKSEIIGGRRSYYRVKAIGVLETDDSDWSNVARK